VAETLLLRDENGRRQHRPGSRRQDYAKNCGAWNGIKNRANEDDQAEIALNTHSTHETLREFAFTDIPSRLGPKKSAPGGACNKIAHSADAARSLSQAWDKRTAA